MYILVEKKIKNKKESGLAGYRAVACAPFRPFPRVTHSLSLSPSAYGRRSRTVALQQRQRAKAGKKAGGANRQDVILSIVKIWEAASASALSFSFLLSKWIYIYTPTGYCCCELWQLLGESLLSILVALMPLVGNPNLQPQWCCC
jgi:hypothetical protein